MEIFATLTDYYLLHYKQQKENIEARLQDRLVVVKKSIGGKTLVIKKLNFWERIRADFDYGPASKTTILKFIKIANKNNENKQLIEEKVNFIFNKTIDHSAVHNVLLTISDCHNKFLMEEVVKQPEVKAQINAKIKNGDTALMLSIKNNNKEAFDTLIHADGITLNTPNLTYEYTALLLAIDLDREEFVKKLVSKGCEIPVQAFSLAKKRTHCFMAIKNASREQKSGLLVDAVERMNTSAFKKIVNELNELDMFPALERAIHNDRLEIVEIILGHGVDNAAAFQIAIKQWAKAELDLESAVFKKFIDLNRYNLQSAISMLSEIYVGDCVRSKDELFKIITVFKDIDNDLHIHGEGCYNALIRAAERGNWNLVEALIAAGVNPNFRPHGASKILLRAAFRGGPEVVNLLLEKGADANYQDSKNNTPIKRAELRLQSGYIPAGREQAERVLAILQKHAKEE